MQLNSIVVLAALVGFGAVASGAEFDATFNQDKVKGAVSQLQSDVPGVSFYAQEERITRIYGRPIVYGSDPGATAEEFRLRYAQVFGIEAQDLTQRGLAGDEQSHPLMYDQGTGEYKFTLIRYSQHKDGLPVFRADLRLLVLNDLDFPLVSVASALRDLGNYAPQVDGLDTAFDPVSHVHENLINFTEPELVIWAGVDDMKVEPRLAYTFIGDNYSTPMPEFPEKWLFVVDARTGEILYREDKVIFTDVTGNVSGKATTIPKADICNPEEPTAMAHARVYIEGGSSTYADADGDFLIPNGGTSTVTVVSPMEGQYFTVDNVQGGEETLTAEVTPPGPVNFMHNNENLSEQVRAQVNGYVQANIVRDWVLIQNPDYPTISSQTNFPVNVNLTTGYCPGNAWYDGTSINFCLSGSGYPNTAFSSVVHHEYGHHAVATGGSGQDQYGEGMSDCFSMLLADDPILGYGFTGDCDAGIRTADNSYQYPCTGEAHDCGQLLSGCVWSTRNYLIVTEPTDYLDILSNLTVNSILMHSGSQITPSITTDFLVLDDDNGDLSDGTPHFDEITQGFGDHNMWAGPPPENDTCANAIFACPGTSYTGNTSSATTDGSSSCGDSSGSPDLWYQYLPGSDGSATFSLCSGTSYDSVLSVHTGCPGSASNEVGCDDDGCGSSGGPSTVTASVTAGVTYYIRVTGWSGSAGSFTLNITGPECGGALIVSLPDGAPDIIAPGTATSFNVSIEDGDEVYVPDTATLHYRYDGGSFQTAPLTPLGGGLFEATLPPASCTDSPEFYVSAEGDGGTVITNPYDAPSSVYTALVGTLTVHFEDDFETDQGWTVENDPGLTAGQWQRGVPVGGGDRGDPASDYDGSGQCYLTQNVDGDSDVDDGWTRLFSPAIDLSGADADVHYALWYTNDYGADPHNDYFYTHVSDDNGSTWVLAETVGPVTQSGWVEHAFTLSEFVSTTSPVKVRFEASDLLSGSVVEAGVDALVVSTFSCQSGASCDDGIQNQGEDRIDCGGPCPPCECTSDGACDNDLFCDGVESCDDWGFCQAGAPVDCDDGVGCTVDSCNEGTDSCDNVPDDALCDNGLFCDGAEWCDPVADCQDGVDPCDPDEICNEEEDVCEPHFCATLPDPSVCKGDVDGDGDVTPADVGLVKFWYGDTSPESLCYYDVDCNGTINPADVGLVKFYYGACTAESELPCWME
jgi:hypothetical protein